MEVFVLTTPGKQRLLINEKEYKALLECLNKGEKFVVIQGHLISLAIAPAVSPFANWYATENERLANSGKRLCKKCLRQMDVLDKCTCWEIMSKGEKQNAFKAPDIIKEFSAGYYKWPELSEDEKQQLEVKPTVSIPRYVENRAGMGYIDKESGEEMYQ
jgi:hypothetical protein